MQGRFESKIKNEQRIANILKKLPTVFSDYYYTMSISLEPRTLLQYLTYLRTCVDFVGKDITEFSSTDIAKYLKHIETKTTKSGEIVPTSSAYRRTVYAALFSIFKYLTNAKKITDNPMSVIDKPKNVDNVKHMSITAEDLNKILAETKNCPYTHGDKEFLQHRDRLILLLLMTTGMRKTALCEINVGDFNLDTATLTIIDKRHKAHEFFLTESTMYELKRYLFLRHRYLSNSKPGYETDALLLSNGTCQRMTIGAVWVLTRHYSQEAIGIPLSPHKFRSAFCSLLYEKTGDIEFVRDAVGHANIATTQRYITKDVSAKKKASDIVGKTIVFSY